MEANRKNILTAVAVIGIGYNIIKFLRYVKWRGELLKTYNVPPPSLFLGNVMSFVDAGGFNEKFFSSLHEKYGPVAGFFLLPNLFNLSITDSEMIADLYSKARSRPLETYMFLKYIGDDNLLFTHGPKVKELRLRYGKMVSSRAQLEKVNKIAQIEFGKLFEQWAKQESVDAFAEVGATIYDVVGKALFEGPWSESTIGQKIYTVHKYLIQNVNKYMILPWLQPFGYSKFLSVNREWRSLCKSLLDERRKEINANPEKWKNDESALTLLLTSEDSAGNLFFSEHLAVTTMCGFLNGAYDTTHSTLFWMLYNMCSYPSEQTKLREEMVKKLGAKHREYGVDEIRELQYLDAFVKESMRMHTTVPVNQRLNLEEDIVISGSTCGSITVPKGVNVNVPVGLVMKDTRYFGQDVNNFRPDRFLDPSEQGERARKAWVQFGGSTRMCVGVTFALVEMKVFLVALLTKYTIDFADPNECFTERMIEAGVNQPEKKLKFKITKVF